MDFRKSATGGFDKGLNRAGADGGGGALLRPRHPTQAQQDDQGRKPPSQGGISAHRRLRALRGGP